MMTSEIKKKTIEVIWKVLHEHQNARLLVDDQIVQLFMNLNRDFDHSRSSKELAIEATEGQYLVFYFDPYFQ